MASHRGPRRTRIYDTNYNIGSSYYKPTLDNLDRKYYGRTTNEPVIAPRVNFNLDDRIDDELSAVRSRANRALTEDTVFDSHGMKSRRGAPLSSMLDDDIDDDVKSSLTRIRAAKKQIATTINDFNVEDGFSANKKRGDMARKFLDLDGEDDFRVKGRSKNLLDMNGEEDTGSRFRSRRLLDTDGEEESRTKFRPRRLLDTDNDEEIGSRARSRALKAISKDDSSAVSSSMSSSFKRVAISDTTESSVNSGASMRAQASKARLADIETEMSERSDRQLAREKRAANLKKLLAESDISAD